MKIIQTNLSYDNAGKLADHQSLTYEIDMDWLDFKCAVLENRKAEIKNFTMPILRLGRRVGREIVMFDEFHMTVEYEDNMTSLFYKVDEQN